MRRRTIAHIIRRLHAGGAETWLMRILREWDRSMGELHFVVFDRLPGVYEAEARSLGAVIHQLPYTTSRFELIKSMSRLMRSNEFDVVHSHVHLFSGAVLFAAYHAGVPVRIAHGHVHTRADASTRIQRKLYVKVMRHLMSRYSTGLVACTTEALRDLVGKVADTDSLPSAIIPCGLRYGDFVSRADAERRRGRIDLLHVGRFVPQKNHLYLLEILEHTLSRSGNARLRLVGEGPGRAAFERQASVRGLTSHVECLGYRSDVASLMTDADVLLLPSFREGLPVVALEAQAVGLPVVASDMVNPQTGVIPELFFQVPLSSPIGEWVDAVAQAILRSAPEVDARIAAFEAFGATVRSNIVMLNRLYAGEPC